MFIFFFNDTATTEIYTLSLHDALPILRLVPAKTILWRVAGCGLLVAGCESDADFGAGFSQATINIADRKSTRLNSSHPSISYAVFCLKKKKKIQIIYPHSQIHTDTQCR